MRIMFIIWVGKEIQKPVVIEWNIEIREIMNIALIIGNRNGDAALGLRFW